MVGCGSTDSAVFCELLCGGTTEALAWAALTEEKILKLFYNPITSHTNTSTSAGLCVKIKLTNACINASLGEPIRRWYSRNLANSVNSNSPLARTNFPIQDLLRNLANFKGENKDAAIYIGSITLYNLLPYVHTLSCSPSLPPTQTFIQRQLLHHQNLSWFGWLFWAS